MSLVTWHNIGISFLIFPYAARFDFFISGDMIEVYIKVNSWGSGNSKEFHDIGGKTFRKVNIAGKRIENR